ACCLACYLAGQLAFSTMLYDPEYSARLEVLQARRAEDPRRPLLLAVGSSRVMMALRPEDLPPLRTPSGQPVLMFNFYHTGPGPVLSLMEVHGLLRAGIRPDWLVVELMPEYHAREWHAYLLRGVGASDLPLLGHYLNPWQLYGHYLLGRLVTEHAHQTDFV